MFKITKELICPVCEKSFYFTRTISGRTPKYCSEACKKKRNNYRTLEKYYKRKGEQPCYTEETMAKYRMRSNPCIRCGFEDATILHDIIPASDGGDRRDSNNRIPLCPNCHATLHKGKWKIWDIEDKLQQNPDYSTQYWLTQLLKSENHSYFYGNNPKT